MYQPTQDEVNDKLSPSDSFSLKDHNDFDISALVSHFDEVVVDSDEDDYDYDYEHDFSTITSQIDLQTMVDTTHVADLNPL